jgi:hypothetical protein
MVAGFYMDLLPFKERYLEGEGVYVREFSADLDPQDMKWHWDGEDREFIVVQSDGWMFQRDNHLPIEMLPGDRIAVKEGEYHRGIKTDRVSTSLIIKVNKL